MWCKKRHYVVTAILRPILKLFFRLKYNCRVSSENLPKQGTIILCNHTMTLDPILVSLKFRQPIYYMTSKHVFQNRFVGKLLKFLVNPIPKEKTNKSDIAAIKTCIKIAKENGNICIFPEGNRTFDGKLCFIDKSIIKLIKHLKQPLIICNIIGGYGSDPRWCNAGRKGKLEIVVRQKYSYDTIKEIDDDTLYNNILSDLTVDDFNLGLKFKGNRRAECLESILHICPICKQEHTLYSQKHQVFCKSCSNKVTYNEDLTLSCQNPNFPFKYVYEWYNFQIETVRNRFFEENKPIYKDYIRLFKPELNKRKELIGAGNIQIYPDSFKMHLDEKTIILNFDEIDAITLIGNKIMDIYSNNTTYRVIGEHHTNLIKYMNIFYILKNKDKEKEFVGI